MRTWIFFIVMIVLIVSESLLAFYSEEVFLKIMTSVGCFSGLVVLILISFVLLTNKN